MSSGGEFSGICRGGPWDGTVFECDVPSWIVEQPRLASLSAKAVPRRPSYGHYVFEVKTNVWRWH
jgi:hypothetical protein